MSVEDGRTWFRYDDTKVAQTLRLDVHPDPHGEHLSLAFKADGERSAFGVSGLSWSQTDFRFAPWELPDEVYDVAILVQIGTANTAEFFVLHNDGDRHTDLTLSDGTRPARESRALFGLPERRSALDRLMRS